MHKRFFINQEKATLFGKTIKKHTVVYPQNVLGSNDLKIQTFGSGIWVFANDDHEARWKPNTNEQTIFYTRIQVQYFNGNTNNNIVTEGYNMVRRKDLTLGELHTEELSTKLYSPVEGLVVGDNLYVTATYRRREGDESSQGWTFQPLETQYRTLGAYNTPFNLAIHCWESDIRYKQRLRSTPEEPNILKAGEPREFLKHYIGDNIFLSISPYRYPSMEWQVVMEFWYFDSGENKLFEFAENPTYN